VRVLVVDDHALFAEALMLTLAIEERIEVVGCASNGLEAISLAEALQPDVVLLDIGMPGPATADVVAGVRAAAPDAAIVVLSGYGPERLDARVAREVAAHLPKTTDLDAVRRTLRAAAGRR
jgi:DNA-binding NarL/FixJ family response regulator